MKKIEKLPFFGTPCIFQELNKVQTDVLVVENSKNRVSQQTFQKNFFQNTKKFNPQYFQKIINFQKSPFIFKKSPFKKLKGYLEPYFLYKKSFVYEYHTINLAKKFRVE